MAQSVYRYNVLGSPYQAVRAESFAAAADRLLRREVRNLHKRSKIHSVHVRQEAGSFDGESEIWCATVQLRESGRSKELAWGGDHRDGRLSRTIMKIGKALK